MLLFLCAGLLAAAAADPVAAPVVVLKMDDLQAREGSGFDNWKRFTAFIDARELKAGIGIIGESLEGDHPQFFNWIKQKAASGRFEFWNHGYDHKQWQEDGRNLREFSGSTLAHQRKHFADTQRLASEKLDLVLTAFGAPFNATDANTVTVLREHPEVTVWMYGDATATAGKFVAKREFKLNLETPVLNPNYDAFVKGWDAGPVPALLVLQGHPPYWSAAQFAEFVRIVDFLQQHNVRFVFPSELPLAAANLR